MVVPQNGWLIWKTLLKWMTWGYHHLRKHPYTQLPFFGWGACEVVIVSEDTCTQPLTSCVKNTPSYSTEETTALFLHFMILDNQHIGKDVGMTPQLTLFGQPHHAAERGRDRPFGSLRGTTWKPREHLYSWWFDPIWKIWFSQSGSCPPFSGWKVPKMSETKT